MTRGVATRLVLSTVAGLGSLLAVAASADLGPHPGLVALNGRLYFSSETASLDEQLFVFNPANGSKTALTAFDSAPSAGVIVVGRIVVFNGKLVFAGRTNANGLEPWSYDPATGTLASLGDLNSGAPGSNPSGFTELGGKLYFAASDATSGGQIWEYDPSGGSTRKTSINGSAGSSPGNLTAFNGRLYFSAFDASVGSTLVNSELWELDPSGSTTKYEINTGSGPSLYDGSSLPTHLTPFDGKLYMQAMGSTSTSGRNNRELYVFTGSSVSLVKELIPAGNVGGEPTGFTASGGKLYFAASDGTSSRLWVLIPGDGTTPRVVGTAVNVANLTAATFDSKVYFTAGPELWSVDPATGTATKRADLPGAGLPSNVREANGKLYLTTSSATFNAQLQAFDPSDDSLTPVLAGAANPASLAVLNDVLYLISNTGGLRRLTTLPGAPLAAGSLVIDEFRLRGPASSLDEYVKITNTTAANIVVSASDGSAGLAVVSSALGPLFVVPNGTVIPPNGHFLGGNDTVSVGYSLKDYGGPSNAALDSGWTSDAPDDRGIALFQSSTTFVLGTRLDAVASTLESNSDYYEGTRLPQISSTAGQYAFVRKRPAPLGTLQDTGDNAADFLLVSTNSGLYNGTQSALGAPGPQGTASPIDRSASFLTALLDPGRAATAVPNQLRTGTGNTGTMQFRRKITNNTGAPVKKLRVRVVDVTTLNGEGYATPSQADLRPATSTDFNQMLSSGTPTAVHGLTLEAPSLPAGGGYNSSLADPDFSLGTPLAPGASVNVNIIFNIGRSGNFRYYVTIEAVI